MSAPRDDDALPAAVTAVLAGTPAVDAPEQALPLLTADPDGQPRAMLLSRAEVAPADAGRRVLLVLRPSTSRSNLLRSGRGTLLVVEGTTLHSAHLRVGAQVEEPDGLVGVDCAVAGGKADSLGIPLVPLGFTPTPALVALEHWQRSAALLARLAARER